MRRAHGVVAALGLLVATVLPACDRGAGGGAGGTDTTAVVVDSLDPICADSTIHHLCPVIPHEVVVQVPNGYTGLIPRVQAKFDMFSWQTFVALNWPANPDGTPLPTFDGNPTAPRVWETYLDATQVYTVQGNLPCNVGPGGKFLGQMAKNGDVVDPGGDYDEAVGGPLSDVNMNYALYEKKINPDEVAYLREHRLNTIPGQMAADSADTALVFTPGRNGGPVGAMEIKAAWRVMMPGDDSTTFYLRHGVIYVPARNSATGRDMCLNATVGLVGLHIIHKTDQFKGDWIWTTFEHVANAPTCTDSTAPGQCGTSGKFSFYNAACTACVANDTMKLRPGDTTFLWQATPPYAGLYPQGGGNYGVQVTRTQAIPPETEGVNTTWTGRVQNTVWRHYRLIGTQWMSGELSDVAVPTLLRNTVLETYLPTSSSCLGCHQFAHTLSNAQGDSVFADFSFLLTMANRTRGFEMLPPRIAQSVGAGPGFRHVTTDIAPNFKGRTNATAAPGAAPAPAPAPAPAAAPPAPPPARPRR
jgi:hypothetical protein